MKNALKEIIRNSSDNPWIKLSMSRSMSDVACLVSLSCIFQCRSF